MEKVQVALADTFWNSFAKLPKAQTKKVVEFFTKFRHAAASSGINYEKINDAAQANFRSVRIDQAYRGIILKPETGRTYILLWVDHHDEAYAWATRTRCLIHPETGVLQLYETEQMETLEQPAIPPVETALVAEKTTPEEVSLYDLDDVSLSGIGVPPEMFETIRALPSESSLEAIQPRLPVEAFEALYLYGGGVPWKEIWDEYHVPQEAPIDTSDIDVALARDASRRRFQVIDGELELQEMLAAPLEKWRVFLHPSQRMLVERDWNGPFRVLGGAGTGKTVVAMHRAVWLANNRLEGEDKKVLFLTYNTNLAQDIAHNLSKIATTDELGKIEVINIDAWVSSFLKGRKYSHKVVGEQELERLWESTLGALKPAEPYLPDSFYKEEWERILLPYRIISQQEYLKVTRRGRGVALNRKQRAQIWPVFDELRSAMQQQGWRTYQDAALDAYDVLNTDGIGTRYSSVVVDEAQDMGSEALQLIRKLTPEGQNDLFLVGDGHQRIYRKKAVMGQCGIRIVGRSKKLKVNYRTTEQIRRFASALLEGLSIDDLDGDEDPRTGYRSLTYGNLPHIQGFYDIAAEVQFIADKIGELVVDESGYSSVCIALRTNGLRDDMANLLQAAGIPLVALGRGADNQSIKGVRLATMHRVKGLEFRHVFLAEMNRGVVPNKFALESEDPVEKVSRELSERALVHVAASRAIEHLYITYHGRPSQLIEI
jgi:superfamily I DNA/RNA helicase